MREVVLFYTCTNLMSDLIDSRILLSTSPFHLLQYVISFKTYEENPASKRHVLIKEKAISIVFYNYNFPGYYAKTWQVVLFVKVSCQVKSETILMNIHTATLKYNDLPCTLNK